MVKNVKNYIIYSLVIYIIIVGVSRLVDFGYTLYQSANNIYPVIIFSLAAPALLGAAFGFETLYTEIHKSGKLHYNILKIILLCIIPLTVAVIEAFGNLKYIPSFADTKLFIYLLCFTFGYNAMTSIYKKEEEIIETNDQNMNELNE